ncbi:helix-turn-helix transcriptional regulator [Sorangium sp. So ce117]|uniref:helix-turn-helix transcriptional regulator n=1 Tax=Sorangium sp. So ce117 TaxID=3133277 RepID=UPI003F5FD37E
MRRADRLFQILQILRRQRAPITAAALAEELETSKRTVYRDIADLLAQRVPIRGEAGTGYVLDRGFDMPPLMLTPDEIEVAVLGAQWVAQRGDVALQRAAKDLIAKIAAAVPERLRPFVFEPATGAPVGGVQAPDTLNLAEVRASIRAGTKIALRYRDETGSESERVVWPVIVGYLESTRLLAAWCELRQDFRHFRTDRVTGARFLDERYAEKPSALRARWLAHMRARGELRERAGATSAKAR